ncbi:MAG: thermonuclease family protein [Candidatus Marinimicrobia bacterium]|nr:thermonuclease family protein [Candidatus Neomarinimicrobiota bacterium]
MKMNLYYYRARVKSVYDGDTCTVDIDLGLRVWLKGEKLRLYGINAPELRGSERPEGLKSRDYLRSLIDGQDVLIETYRDKRGKYGRYLAVIYIDRQGAWLNVNEELVKKGFAVFKEY